MLETTSRRLIGTPDDYGDPDPEWLRIDWRQHLHEIELDGARVNYVDIGEGEEVVLFVHGLCGCWRNWLENLPHFSRGRRAIALDLPGFGHSPMPSWDISMDRFGSLLHEFCDRLGLERVAALVGNSMGGFAATEAVIDRPERFERLVLISAAGVSFAEAKGRRWGAGARTVGAAAPFLARDRDLILRRPLGRFVAFGRLFRYPNRLRPELLGEQVDPGLASPGLVDSLEALIGYDTRDRLGEIEIPTLIVWGLSDKIVPPVGAFDYRHRIPSSRLEIFERTGHLPQLERPRRFNPLLDAFLDE